MCLYTCTHTHTHKRTCTHTRVGSQTCIHTHACTQMYTHPDTPVGRGQWTYALPCSSTVIFQDKLLIHSSLFSTSSSTHLLSRRYREVSKGIFTSSLKTKAINRLYCIKTAILYLTKVLYKQLFIWLHPMHYLL